MTGTLVLTARAGALVSHGPKPWTGAESSKTPMALTLEATGDAADTALVRHAQDGDAASFATLVDRHYARAFAVARRIVRDRETAEEATQDAFVRAWRALPRFRGDALFSTWLHRIVARCALDHVRRRARWSAEVAVDAWAEAAAPEPHEEGEIDALLGELSTLRRAAVVLFYYGDRSVREIAVVLGQPENTVKTHLHRARAVLRRAWLDKQATESIR